MTRSQTPSRHATIADLGPDAQRQAIAQIGAQPPKRNKYGAVRQAYKSIQGFERTYDSTGEANYAARLDGFIQSGMLAWWLPQVPIPLPGGVKYVADFLLSWKTGFIEFVDFKGKDTQASINKRKQVEAIFGIKVRIVGRAA